MGNYTIVMFPKIQDDTAVCYFLLKEFGEAKFPGIKNASVEFWTEMPDDKTVDELEAEGYILIDFGSSKFDHHKFGQDNKTICAATLVAKYLEIEERPELQKMIEFARRSDLEGKGTLSKDSIDRAFGFPGLLSCLNKIGKYKPSEILQLVVPLIEAHYLHEHLKYDELPKEYQAGLQNGTMKEFNAVQFGKQLKIIYSESDNTALAGYLRSKAVGADMVIQKASTGHVNFITRQAAGLNLNQLARQIKLIEAEKNGIILNIDSMDDLELPGRTEGLPHWYYDTRANTLQNGGINPQNIPPTTLTFEEIELATKQGLNVARSNQQQNRNFHNPHHQHTNRNNQNRGRRDNFRRSHGAIIID